MGPRYSYAVVSGNGAGKWSQNLTLPKARALLPKIARANPLSAPFEIERIQHLGDGGGVRYQVRQRSRWVPWDPHRGPELREPDWIAR